MLLGAGPSLGGSPKRASRLTPGDALYCRRYRYVLPAVTGITEVVKPAQGFAEGREPLLVRVGGFRPLGDRGL